jgi:hypothetical protein
MMTRVTARSRSSNVTRLASQLLQSPCPEQISHLPVEERFSLNVPHVWWVVEDQLRALEGHWLVPIIGMADTHAQPRQHLHRGSAGESEGLRRWFHPVVSRSRSSTSQASLMTAPCWTLAAAPVASPAPWWRAGPAARSAESTSQCHSWSSQPPSRMPVASRFAEAMRRTCRAAMTRSPGPGVSCS